MRPTADRLVVEREANERQLASGIVLPGHDMGLAFMGRVTHVGPQAHDVCVGERILYSARIDTYRLGNGQRTIDIVPEGSVIGRLA